MCNFVHHTIRSAIRSAMSAHPFLSRRLGKLPALQQIERNVRYDGLMECMYT